MTGIHVSTAQLSILLALAPIAFGTGCTGSQLPPSTPRLPQAEPKRVLTIQGIPLRVFHSGRLERLTLPGLEQDRWAGDIDKGTTRPVPSSDQRFVAYTRDLDVWVYDVVADSAFQLTRLALPGDDILAAAFLYIAAWSSDSRQLLVYLDHDELEAPEGRDYLLQPADYGLYRCTISRLECSRLTLPGYVEAWLPSGDYLLTTQEPSGLIRYEPESQTSTIFEAARGAHQFDVTRRGDRALLNLWVQDADNDLVPAIFALDLLTGSLTPLLPLDSAVNQWSSWGTYSPSGDRVAHVARLGRSVQGTIIVDGRPVYRCRSTVSPCRHYWVTDEVIAVAESLVRSVTLLTIVDVDTGRVKAEHTLER